MDGGSYHSSDTTAHILSNMTPLCQQKASFLAPSSVEKVGNIFLTAIILVILFSIAIELFNIDDKIYEATHLSHQPAPQPATRATVPVPRTKDRWVLEKFLVSTPLMALNGFCFALVVLCNQHSYYCGPWHGHGTDADENWKTVDLDTPKDWVFIALFPGMLALCGLSNWLRSLTNVFLARWKVYVPLKRWPPALPILAIVVPMGLVVRCFYKACLCGFKMWIREKEGSGAAEKGGRGQSVQVKVARPGK